ncbi:Hypothetical protein R9X50_00602500 [Acrodontium crateriforme]|uniref:Uncharacterized protein n=1 Tax=Acrodontium crateriforme TaxID=150365 RepID=A0AAQ3R9K7_9PEZI|nr:Hypothetical protein R9X50_00602500 [Acrodontium crateriforme]
MSRPRRPLIMGRQFRVDCVNAQPSSPSCLLKHGSSSSHPSHDMSIDCMGPSPKALEGVKTAQEDEMPNSLESSLSSTTILIDNDHLMSPIEVFCKYNPDLGAQVCAARARKKELDDFVHRIRVRRYSEAFANEHRGNRTPIDMRIERNREEEEALQRYLKEEEEYDTSEFEGD